jgi:hypothetical protein
MKSKFSREDFINWPGRFRPNKKIKTLASVVMLEEEGGAFVEERVYPLV